MVSQPPTAGPPALTDDEDEINLLDLFLVLVRRKWLIFWMVFVAGVAAVTISLLLTNIYRSEATIAPREEDKGAAASLSTLGGLGGFVASELGLGGGGSLEKLEVLLRSRDLSFRVIQKNDLLPVLFPDRWDSNANQWREDDKPSLEEANRKIQLDLLKVTSDTTKKTIVIGFDQPDPKMSQQIVGHYLTELSEMLREQVLQDAAENQRFFQEQLQKTSDALLRDKIYAMLAKEIEKETFAKAQKYYSFLVLDPPFLPDPKFEVKPKRAIICVLSVAAAFFMAVMWVFFLDFVQRVKTQEPERFREILEGLKFWKRRKGKDRPL
jgi:uncharacterized protein involved in exopolysaccharide biosynthesis